jgi:hypothetical protein
MRPESPKITSLREFRQNKDRVGFFQRTANTAIDDWGSTYYSPDNQVDRVKVKIAKFISSHSMNTRDTVILEGIEGVMADMIDGKDAVFMPPFDDHSKQRAKEYFKENLHRVYTQTSTSSPQ